MKRKPKKNTKPTLEALIQADSYGAPYSDNCEEAMEGLKKLGYKIRLVTEKSLPRFKVGRHMPVKGTARFVRTAIHQMGLKQPDNVDIPPSLYKHANRRVWETTLGDLRRMPEEERNKIFIKSRRIQKCFSGGMFRYRASELVRLRDDFEILASERIEMDCENRYFVLNGKVVNKDEIKPDDFDPETYTGFNQWGGRDYQVPTYFVQKIADDYENPHAAYAIDVCWSQKDGKNVPTVVELNEIFSAANFCDVTPVMYAECLIARWNQIVEQGS